MTIKDFGGLAEAAREAQLRFKRLTWFRGQASARQEWTLCPAVHRSYARDDEADMFCNFMRQAGPRCGETPPRGEPGKWLTLMRHYGVPTRLLEWTESIMTAAFFAVNERHDDEDGLIWALSPCMLNQHFGNEPLVYLMGTRPSSELEIAAVDRRRPYIEQILAVTAEQIDLRMMLQQSVFTIHGSPKPLDHLENHDGFLIRFVIPKEAKQVIRMSLEIVGVTQISLFPDLDHLAQELASQQLRSKLNREAEKRGPESQ